MGKHEGKRRRDLVKSLMGRKTLTTGEAAVIIGVTSQTIVNWCENGTLACHRAGPRGRRRIKKEDIDAMISKNLYVFEPKKTIHVPGSVIPMIDNQIRIHNHYAVKARQKRDSKSAQKFDYMIEGLALARRIVEVSITRKELDQYKEKGVDYAL